MLECSGFVANNQEYWRPLLAYFNENLRRTADMFYRFLMTRELASYNVREFPHTEAKAAIMVESRDNVTAFLQRNIVHPDAGFNQEEFITTGRLYELYKAFVENGDVYRQQMRRIQFARKMRALLAGFEHRRSMVRGYKFKKQQKMRAMMKKKGQWCEDQK